MQVLHSSSHVTRIVEKSEDFNFRSSVCSFFTYGHESWIMTKRVRSQAQAIKRGSREDLKELHYLTRSIALKFKNLLTSSRYFSE